MIKYEWRTELSAAEADELRDVLQRASEYDAEPGYSTIDFASVAQSMAEQDSKDCHLVIWMLPHATALAEPDEPERIAGLVRLQHTGSGCADGTAVIDPRLRSIGIMTLLTEQLGLDTTGPTGWVGTGAHTISCWARGNHPAAGRLSNRFLVPRTRQVWQLIRGTDPDPELAGAPVLEPAAATGAGTSWTLREAGRALGTATLSSVTFDSEEFGVCSVISDIEFSPSAPAGALRRLLYGISVIAHEAGRTGVVVNVDSNDPALVNAARLAGFHHDRTDVRYQLGGTP
ncbi:hypothetical protein MANY_02170 [Mycolicibacterium anyangense]|uniref:Uncharacterized protein n=1 Tax=Mycolicibacterium anyangense TaxID=1431246 RepID=A0A6N4VZ35_9MYCO|nr:hypothetical protein [Mycolicibacterium anyangense]BBZ74880.1 hypothetical protein MANY_02170 [Mycolicibacterium anyangense]